VSYDGRGRGVEHEAIATLGHSLGKGPEDSDFLGAGAVGQGCALRQAVLNLRQVKALAARFHVPMEALAG
jgi:hypothetical protein